MYQKEFHLCFYVYFLAVLKSIAIDTYVKNIKVTWHCKCEVSEGKNNHKSGNNFAVWKIKSINKLDVGSMLFSMLNVYFKFELNQPINIAIVIPWAPIRTPKEN